MRWRSAWLPDHRRYIDVTGDPELLGKPALAIKKCEVPLNVSLLGLDHARELADSLTEKAVKALSRLTATAGFKRIGIKAGKAGALRCSLTSIYFFLII